MLPTWWGTVPKEALCWRGSQQRHSPGLLLTRVPRSPKATVGMTVLKGEVCQVRSRGRWHASIAKPRFVSTGAHAHSEPWHPPSHPQSMKFLLGSGQLGSGMIYHLSWYCFLLHIVPMFRLSHGCAEGSWLHVIWPNTLPTLFLPIYTSHLHCCLW